MTRRVVFLARAAAPAFGGTEAYLRSVSDALARQGWDVTILAQTTETIADLRLTHGASRRWPPFSSFVEEGGTEVKQLVPSRLARLLLMPFAVLDLPVARRFAFTPSVRTAFLRAYGRAVRRTVRRETNDATVVHAWGADLMLAAALGSGRPVVVTAFVHPGSYGDDDASARLYRDADAVTGLLPGDLRLQESFGVPAARAALIPVCASFTSAEEGRSTALRAGHGISGSLVLFLGVRRAYKGLALLADAVTKLRLEGRDLHVAFVGPGDAIEEKDGVIDAGAVSDAERSAWIQASDVICLPSEQEIFPVSFLDAWSHRVPVLASDIPNLKELIGLSGGGLSVERTAAGVADGLRSLLDDPGERRRLGGQGHDFWRRHATPEAVARRLSEAYERIERRASLEVLHDLQQASSA